MQKFFVFLLNFWPLFLGIIIVIYFVKYNLTTIIFPKKLGTFLTSVNDRKLFLNTRIISAEDVTNNAKIAELELKKINKTGEVISQMKTNEKKANLTEENEEKNNTQQIENNHMLIVFLLFQLTF